MRVPVALLTVLAVATLPLGGCAPPAGDAVPAEMAGTSGSTAPGETVPDQAGPDATAREAFLDDLERRTFDFFWETADAEKGLVPDRWPSNPFSSVAAIGFGLTALPVGVERGYVSRQAARRRVLASLRFLHDAPQGPGPRGVIGDRGFYYHFLEPETGLRFETVELSTIDTALLMAGVLFVQQYFDGDGAEEVEIRQLADALYRRVEWPWFDRDERGITMAWHPEPEVGFGVGRWTGYDEAILLHVLALGSPTHPLDPEVWQRYTASYRWDELYGQDFLQFAPLFGHQYSHVWIDFRGIQDAYMQRRGIDYFENSRRATLAQRAYGEANPDGWRGYDAEIWGLTACDGPTDATLEVDGRRRTFHTYWARGVAAGEVRDDGTVAPTAAGGSVPFAPDAVIPSLMAMRERYGDNLYRRYGFVDAFNPTLDDAGVPVHHGHVVPGVGWFDDEYLGIDQGPIVLMLENHRSGFVWETMKQSPYLVRGLCRAGFRGGWLTERCENG
jgi:hypothetical protein